MSHRGRERDTGKERLWREAIGRWQHSGLTIRGFCRREGLKEGSFHSWRRTIARRDRSVAPAMSGDRQPLFVPVRMTPTAAAVPLELVLGGGRVVRVPPGFDGVTLRALLAVLEEGPSC